MTRTGFIPSRCHVIRAQVKLGTSLLNFCGAAILILMKFSTQATFLRILRSVLHFAFKLSSELKIVMKIGEYGTR